MKNEEWKMDKKASLPLTTHVHSTLNTRPGFLPSVEQHVGTFFAAELAFKIFFSDRFDFSVIQVEPSSGWWSGVVVRVMIGDRRRLH